jgi:hypothetical protein
VDARRIAGYRPKIGAIEMTYRQHPSQQENSMETGRRYFLSNIALVLAGAQMLQAGGRQQMPPALPSQFPDESSPSNRPRRNDLPLPPMADPKVQLKESQKNLRRDADRLLQLANELKDEAYKTEQTDVLSLSLIHKAEEVEKLAHQIKDLVRAA